MSARIITPVRSLSIVKVIGLAPPPGRKRSPFLWYREFSERTPFFLRFVWNPQSGTTIIGVEGHHTSLIPPSRRYPFASWVRGFYFPAWRLYAIRLFFWPQKKDDPWDTSHSRMNHNIMRILSPLLRHEVPRAKVAVNIDNQWLQERTGLVSW